MGRKRHSECLPLSVWCFWLWCNASQLPISRVTMLQRTVLCRSPTRPLPAIASSRTERPCISSTKVGRGWGSYPPFPKSGKSGAPTVRVRRQNSKALTTRRLLLLVDVNLFVVVCVVSEGSTFSRQCPCIDDRLKSRDNDSGVRDFYIQRGFDDKHSVV